MRGIVGKVSARVAARNKILREKYKREFNLNCKVSEIVGDARAKVRKIRGKDVHL